jgi:alanyl-tRNA synthetase
MTSAQIRQQFIDFFVKKHGHTFVPSSPVVPADDPTLLFTNAGMNQFKPIFLGQEKRSYTRAVNTQKCIRAGGKHNDLDDVGRSRRHHTFFEMLGNWSFGDYFKRGAIEMAWELLTVVWKIDPARLHVSCYEGNETAGIPRDTDAAKIWREVAGIPEDHIHFFGKDNFWEMGDTGPCGPCTEIYVDRRPDAEIAAGGRAPVNGDDPRVMEIWNNVFIQYNRDASGKLTTLPAQHVDTGMGLERICQVLQEKDDNFATDLWTPLFDKISELSGLKYRGLFPKTNAADPVAEAANEQLRHDIAFRVVADHVRCLTFALTDGAVPSNEGRGYVLRRILRRAVRFGRQQLGLTEPFLHRLSPVVVESMSGAFPELRRDPQRVIDLIKDEEISFSKTLDRGIQLFEEAALMAKHNAMSIENNDQRAGVRLDPDRLKQVTPTISGRDAFKLHDTYGFPIDLTRIMAEERGMTVDVAGYEKLMEQARQLARAGGKEGESKIADLSPDALAQLAQANAPKTDDEPKYRRDPIDAKVLAIWNGDDLGLSPASVFEDEELAIILDRTNFYAEMGGQVGDSGELRAGSNIFDVQTTHAVGGYVLHIGRLRSGKIHVGESIRATVAVDRVRTEKNHTGTHLANWALREVLGDGVQQKGSLVDPEKLRFDFSHSKAMTDEEISRVEQLVRGGIANRLPVDAQTAPQELALKINGLRAVFGEKYPPMVRVVCVGAAVKDLLADPANPKWRQYSIEFCGGTHLGNSSEISGFVVTAEESVSKGIRRLVALTGDAAAKVDQTGREIEELIVKSQPGKTADADLPALIGAIQKSITGPISLRTKRRAQATITDLQSRHKALEKASRSQGGGGVDAVAAAASLLASAKDVAGGKLIVGEIPGATDDQLRSAVDSLRKKAPSHAILVGAGSGEKVTFVAAISDDLVAKGLRAGEWVKQTATITGGGGGGRPQMAQGSGKDPAKLSEALEAGRKMAMEILGK